MNQIKTAESYFRVKKDEIMGYLMYSNHYDQWLFLPDRSNFRIVINDAQVTQILKAN